MLNGFPMRCQVGEVVVLPVRLLGAGAATPTLEVGPGVTMSRTGVGVYRITTRDYVGKLLGVLTQCGQAAPAAAGGLSVVWDHDSYTATSKALDIYVQDSETGAAVELTAADKVFILLVFNQGGPIK